MSALTLVREMSTRVRMGGRWCAMAVFNCACGKVVTLAARTKLKDCGCGSYTAPVREAHGGSNLASYAVWQGMKARCADTSDPRYGGRGIAVCERWRTSFEAFITDMGPRPFDAASLDRIDVNGGYWCGKSDCADCGPPRRPRNVRWADATTQARNTTRNRTVTAFGETLCIAEWSERFGVKAGAIAHRLDAGWPAESAVSTPAFNFRHGDSHAPEYHSWRSIIQRCENPKSHDFKRYGGRGIRMCERWRESYETFLNDVGRKPSSHHTIERIDVDGHYEPGNCRWATPDEQQRNRRSNHRITVNGETRCVSEWARWAGCSPDAILRRLKLGWSPEAAVTKPIRQQRNNVRCDSQPSAPTAPTPDEAPSPCLPVAFPVVPPFPLSWRDRFNLAMLLKVAV